MSDLIKQAEECLAKPSELHSEHEKALYVLRDCVTEIERLSKPYVPMTRDEFDALLDIWCDIGIRHRPDWASYIEAEVCRRAGIEVVK